MEAPALIRPTQTAVRRASGTAVTLSVKQLPQKGHSATFTFPCEIQFCNGEEWLFSAIAQ